MLNDVKWKGNAMELAEERVVINSKLDVHWFKLFYINNKRFRKVLRWFWSGRAYFIWWFCMAGLQRHSSCSWKM